MCGFVGFWNTPEVADYETVIHAMADRIIHRGPDDAHYYVDDDISLGFRRLSIIDLEGGRQPILNEGRFKGPAVQWRDLQLPESAGGFTAERPYLYYEIRFRNHPSRLRGIRKGNFAKAAGNVRFCYLG